MAKVMFLQVCVCPQGGRVSASVHAGMPSPPGWRAPLDGEPPQDGEPPRWRTPRIENPPRWRSPRDGEPPCRGITRIHRSPSRPRPSMRPTAAFINIHEHLIKCLVRASRQQLTSDHEPTCMCHCIVLE